MMRVDRIYIAIAPYLPSVGTKGSMMSRMRGWMTKIYIELMPTILIFFQVEMGIVLIKLIAMQTITAGIRFHK